MQPTAKKSNTAIRRCQKWTPGSHKQSYDLIKTVPFNKAHSHCNGLQCTVLPIH